MHLSFYFISEVSKALAKILPGQKLNSAFSQNKNEIIFEFEKDDNSAFYIKALLSPSFSNLSFPHSFHRARKNTVNLFLILEKAVVQSVNQYENERAFSIEFDNNHTLVFKLFGNRSNILLYERSTFVEIFHKKVIQDIGFTQAVNQQDSVAYSDFKNDPDIRKWFPKLRGIPELFLNENGFQKLNVLDQWNEIQSIIGTLEKPKAFYIIELNDEIALSLLPIGQISEAFDSPIDASNAFFKEYITRHSFKLSKQQALSKLKSEAKKSSGYIGKSTEKLKSISSASDYQQLGDVIMANLHAIPAHVSSTSLLNFYSGQNVEIKLKSNLSPQKNAENYYRKAKNQYREIETLQKNIDDRKLQLSELNKTIEQIEACESQHALKLFSKSLFKSVSKKSQGTSHPYMEREISGFKILIGRNAKSNDKILSNHTHKDDLWLHVKDASGSHVIIKQKSGKNYFPELIEKAAQLAAFYSKRKSETLVPVSYTPRKYVRKRKGDPPGMVVVEKEKVILTEPKNLS